MPIPRKDRCQRGGLVKRCGTDVINSRRCQTLLISTMDAQSQSAVIIYFKVRPSPAVIRDNDNVRPSLAVIRGNVGMPRSNRRF